MALPRTAEDLDRMIAMCGGMAKLLRTPYEPSDFYREMISCEPWPHLVHYQGEKARYMPPERYLFTRAPGPSDCTWMVPGTGQRK